MNILVDIYNNTIHAATGYKPRQVVFNFNNQTDTEDIIQNYNKIQSDIKVLMEKRRRQVEMENKQKNQPTVLETGKNIYVKVGQRITKDKEPFAISKIIETFKDSHGVKIHKNRIKS